MSTPERDDELEKFLAQRAVLPRALQEREQAEPPPELDRLVLRQARAAIEPGVASKMLRRNRWFVPLTLAATIVLSFTIVLRIQQSGDSPYTPMSGRVMEPAATSRAQDAPEQKAEAPRLRQIPERTLRREIAVPQLDTAEATSADNATPAVPLSEEIPGLAKEAPAVAESESRQSVANAAAEGNASVASRAAAPPPAPDAAGFAKVESPQAWLERIRKLRADGKAEEADREFQAFRSRYPNYLLDNPVKE